MPRSTLLLVSFVGGLILPMGAVAQNDPESDEARQASTHDHTQVNQKRGITEEGGVKASGPSQGKGGESR